MKATIAVKLALAFAVVLLLAIGLSFYQLIVSSGALAFLSGITDHNVRVYGKLVDIIEGRSTLKEARCNAIIDAALGKVPGAHAMQAVGREDYDRVAAQTLNAMADLEAIARELAVSSFSPEPRKVIWSRIAMLAADLQRLEKDTSQKTSMLFADAQQGRVTEAVADREIILANQTKLDESISQIQVELMGLAQTGRQEIAAADEQVVRYAVGATILIVAVGALVTWGFGRSLILRLSRYVDFAREIGQGNLLARVGAEGGDELAALGQHLNQMADGLAELAKRARGMTESTSRATAEIRTSTQEQATAVNEQLSAVEQTTATLSEITHSGAQIAQRAKEVEHNAQGAKEASGTGLLAVEDFVTAMDAIRQQVETVATTIMSLSERTQAIGEIILTVNTIAERSHLLALNAAIEAAAAGEQGRSFSIVATEMKQLAEQARAATVQVRSNLGEIQHGINASALLAEETTKRVEMGRQQSTSADHAIRSLAENVEESLQAFQQIVAAINQHQIGLEQAMISVKNIANASRQSSVATRQLEQAAQSLSKLAESLLVAIQGYRV